MEQIFYAVEEFPGYNSSLGHQLQQFYTNVCAQSSENHLFPLPEKEDGEQRPQGNELVLLV
jgi:hypothetical protein